MTAIDKLRRNIHTIRVVEENPFDYDKAVLPVYMEPDS